VAFREISAAIFLYTQGSVVLSVTVYDLWSNGDYPVVAALGVIMVLFLALVALLVQRMGARLGIGIR
jgi:iron(III) transport system permease protein